MTPDPARCVVIVPVSHHVEPACEVALQGLEARGYAVWRRWGHSNIGRGRSLLATEALDRGFEEILWIDADIVFRPPDVDHLRALGLPLVGGLYPLKGLRRVAAVLEPETDEVVFGEGGGLLAVRYLATGFLHTRREVYEAVGRELPRCLFPGDPPIVPYFLELLKVEPAGTRYLSEDYAFCERARSAGFAIVADTRLRLGHLGSYVYSYEDSGKQVERVATFRLKVGRRG